jgi:ABC-type Fe2+-enterobactin transport system substrate-binding protein
MEKTMIKIASKSAGISSLVVAGVVGLLASCATMSPMMGGQRIALNGANEVPAVTTTAAGNATVDIKADRSVTATVTVTGMTATASHIHEGAAGANGPVIVPFVKTGDNTFAAAEGAKLTEAQYESYKAGKLYVNVHSANNPGGEIRAQLKGN